MLLLYAQCERYIFPRSMIIANQDTPGQYNLSIDGRLHQHLPRNHAIPVPKMPKASSLLTQRVLTPNLISSWPFNGGVTAPPSNLLRMIHSIANQQRPYRAIIFENQDNLSLWKLIAMGPEFGVFPKFGKPSNSSVTPDHEFERTWTTIHTVI